MQLNSDNRSAVARFIERSRVLLGGLPIQVMENPTEEIMRDLKRGKSAKLYAQGKAPTRLEENYLYDSRGFTLGAIAAGDFRFFANPIGAPGAANGFAAAGFVLTDLETNLDTASQVPQGKNFVFKQIGISFNAEILTGDVAQLMDAGSLRYTKQGDQYTLRHGPVRLWPGGTGVEGYSATTVAATTIAAAHNGVASSNAARMLKVARVIREKETFSYLYSVPRATRQAGAAPAAWALVGNCVMTVWLWGGQFDTIPG
jgi:hypothetical protein